ncbi:MAG: formamidopyrimidine-DNA glycosylase [Chlamydiales bacterium]
MPELPEVETTVRMVRPGLQGRTIRGLRVGWERSLGGMSSAQFGRRVRGARIAQVSRRAKYIVLSLERSGSPSGFIFVHLRMSGRLCIATPAAPLEAGLVAYTRVRLKLDRGELAFVDVRKFGRFVFVNEREEITAGLGPEPLGKEFTESGFRQALGVRKRLLKPLLLDQTFLAGLGNIYVDEALHRAGLHPQRRSDRVPAAAVGRLYREIRATLSEAIEREGSSFDGFYRTPEGQPGQYQAQFRVYGRTGRPCLTCGRAIKRIVVGQRGTHFCTRCQPAPRPNNS